MASAQLPLSSDAHVLSTFSPLLHPKSIRLLQLAHWADTGPSSSDVFKLGFIIRQFELDACSEYYALSYTWGEACRADTEYTEDEIPPSSDNLSTICFLGEIVDNIFEPASREDSNEDITERGKRFSITKNLQDGLEQLAISGILGKWLWIDAICIDQENNAEKEVQVALMGEIYSKALKVIIWLGADTTDLKEFAWLCEDFLIAMSEYIVAFGVEDLRAQSPFNLKLLENCKEPCPTGDLIACFEKYLRFCRRRRWFSRIWIVQETVLARDIVVQCGATMISWEQVETLGTMIKTLGWQPLIAPNVGNNAFGRAISDETIRLSMVKQHLCVEQQRLSNTDVSIESVDAEWYIYLQVLLYQTRPYMATDPRDKIFGLLGIAQTALSEGSSIPLRPDYSSSSTVASVYTSVASMLLKNVPRLANLSFLEDPGTRRIKNLPSWVPDYTVTLTPSPLILIRRADHSFNCSPSADTDCSLTIEGNVLQVRAAVFDAVAKVSSSLWDMLKTSNIESCLQVCRNVVQPYLDTNQDPSEVLMRTLTVDTYKQLPTPHTMLPVFKKWARNRIAFTLTPDILSYDESGAQITNVQLDEARVVSQLAFLQDSHDTLPSAQYFPSVEEVLTTVRTLHRFKLQTFVAQHAILDPNDPFPTQSEQLDRIESEAALFHEPLGLTVPFRRLFRTERGFLGLGPESLKVGDKVWLLKDAKVPFVLKQGEEEGTMRLVGECYLHGWMDGRMDEEVGGKADMIKII